VGGDHDGGLLAGGDVGAELTGRFALRDDPFERGVEPAVDPLDARLDLVASPLELQ